MENDSNNECPHYLPMYLAQQRFKNWLEKADLNNYDWDKILTTAKQLGFDSYDRDNDYS